MNIIDCIARNKFLKDLFPDGLQGDILIGHFGIDIGDRFSLVLHTKQRPNKEIVKWGVWGKDYDVITINLLGTGVDAVEIINWRGMKFGQVKCELIAQKVHLSSEGCYWRFAISYESVIFQGCNVYID